MSETKNKICPVCLTEQEGAHSCGIAKPVEQGKSCVHDFDKDVWSQGNSYAYKVDSPICPYCKALNKKPSEKINPAQLDGVKDINRYEVTYDGMMLNKDGEYLLWADHEAAMKAEQMKAYQFKKIWDGQESFWKERLLKEQEFNQQLINAKNDADSKVESLESALKAKEEELAKYASDELRANMRSADFGTTILELESQLKDKDRLVYRLRDCLRNNFIAFHDKTSKNTAELDTNFKAWLVEVEAQGISDIDRELDELKSKIKDKDARIAELERQALLDMKEVTELVKERDALREDLNRYGNHMPRCRSGLDANSACYCGFNEALGMGGKAGDTTASE